MPWQAGQSRVLFEPEVTTVVSSEFVQSGEQFDDILTAYAAKGQWIDGTDVVAEGTLYGPMLALTEESDTAPSWAPIAGTTTQTLSAAGEFIAKYTPGCSTQAAIIAMIATNASISIEP